MQGDGRLKGDGRKEKAREWAGMVGVWGRGMGREKSSGMEERSSAAGGGGEQKMMGLKQGIGGQE